jgi:Bacterial inner membrane protein
MHVTDVLGWIATAVFTASYFFKRAALLRRAQMGAALLWVAYGVLVGAAPVVVANLLVLAAALVAGLSQMRNAERGVRN